MASENAWGRGRYPLPFDPFMVFAIIIPGAVVVTLLPQAGTVALLKGTVVGSLFAWSSAGEGRAPPWYLYPVMLAAIFVAGSILDAAGRALRNSWQKGIANTGNLNFNVLRALGRVLDPPDGSPDLPRDLSTVSALASQTVRGKSFRALDRSLSMATNLGLGLLVAAAMWAFRVPWCSHTLSSWPAYWLQGSLVLLATLGTTTLPRLSVKLTRAKDRLAERVAKTTKSGEALARRFGLYRRLLSGLSRLLQLAAEHRFLLRGLSLVWLGSTWRELGLLSTANAAPLAVGVFAALVLLVAHEHLLPRWWTELAVAASGIEAESFYEAQRLEAHRKLIETQEHLDEVLSERTKQITEERDEAVSIRDTTERALAKLRAEHATQTKQLEEVNQALDQANRRLLDVWKAVQTNFDMVREIQQKFDRYLQAKAVTDNPGKAQEARQLAKEIRAYEPVPPSEPATGAP